MTIIHVPSAIISDKVYLVVSKTGRILCDPRTKVGTAKADRTRFIKKFKYNQEDIKIYQVTEVKEYDPLNP
jgi:hypothetical protein